MRVVIADTSPIQYLHQAAVLALLPELFGQITIPQAVADEIEAGCRHNVSSGRDEFEARLFQFGETARSMEAELYLLRRGEYTVTVRTAVGEVLSKTPVTIGNSANRIVVELPARVECVLAISAGCSR